MVYPAFRLQYPLASRRQIASTDNWSRCRAAVRNFHQLQATRILIRHLDKTLLSFPVAEKPQLASPDYSNAWIPGRCRACVA